MFLNIIKRVLFIISLFVNILSAQNGTELILKEIQTLREDMNKRFEQVDKRFEQVDKRFEQVDKRFDFMQNILYALIGLIFASPFIAIYLRDKREASANQASSDIKSVLSVLRHIAKDDKKLYEELKIANLM